MLEHPVHRRHQLLADDIRNVLTYFTLFIVFNIFACMLSWSPEYCANHTWLTFIFLNYLKFYFQIFCIGLFSINKHQDWFCSFIEGTVHSFISFKLHVILKSWNQALCLLSSAIPLGTFSFLLEGNMMVLRNRFISIDFFLFVGRKLKVLSDRLILCYRLTQKAKEN